jgi:SAM-dependent methyltransferase
MPVGPGARVSYVDRLPREELVKLYVDVDPQGILPVDIVTDGESLPGVADDSQDFVIANHMVEHCEDPIGTLRHMLRVLKVGGVLYLTLPDKRFTFDHDRPVTSFEHVRDDYLQGPIGSRHGHYVDWLIHVERVQSQGEIEERARGLGAERANIHFHAWDQAAVMEMLARMQRELGFMFDVEVMSRTGLEVIFVMRKTGPVPQAPTR